MSETKKMKWWHGIIIYVLANAITLLMAAFNGDEAFYNDVKQPGIAPPDWMFAPVWFINNVTSLIALYIVVNLPWNTPNRRSVIMFEAWAWVLYAIFTSLYFGLKSPILGATDTVSLFILTTFSFFRVYRISRKAAWLIAPRLVWLMLAAYVSGWIALHNEDTFFQAGPWISGN